MHTVGTLTRRSLLAAGASALIVAAAERALKVGVIADVHHGLMPDAHARLQAFLAEAEKRPLDFVIQLGDFCHPRPDAQAFLKSWHSYKGRKYNVLGNHDLDFGTKRQIMDLLEMERNYYSFDAGSFHFVVLDCNYINRGDRFEDFDHGNYFGASDRRDWVNTEQIEWLKADLAATKRPTLVFTHQCVNGYWASEAPARRANVRQAITEANRKAGWKKIFACFSGHEHADDFSVAEGVSYFLVNSASYYWVGEERGRLAKYKDPLFCFLTIDPAGKLELEGRPSSFIPPSPAERGHPNGAYSTASIRNRSISFRAESA